MKLSLAAASLLTLLSAAPAFAGELPSAGFQIAQNDHTIGTPHPDQWIYDRHGDKMGSIRSIDHVAGTAQIMVGSYFEPGSHVATVPLSSLTMSGSRVVMLNDDFRG